MPTNRDARVRVDALTRELLAFYSDAWDRITREEAQIRDTWLTTPRPRRLARLAQLQATVEHLMDNADRQAFAFVTGELPQAYHFGAVDSGYAPTEWSKVDIDAVNRIASSTYDDLLTATRFVRQATKTLVRTLTRQQIGAKLLTGQTAREAGRELADVFARQGIAAVTYANGARVGLEQYASMLTRTQSALAYNQGNYNQYAANDIGFVECFDDPDCGLDGHDDEEKPNGQVYELAVMEEFPISHPNCISEGSRVVPIGKVLAAYRCWYSGPMVDIRTARGSLLTVTPNHPVLTGRGWIPAHLVQEGDQVVHGAGHRQIPLVGLLRDEYLDDMPPRVEEVFEALAAVGTNARVVAAADDFHGDGRGVKGDIDVVWADGELPLVGQVLRVEGGAEAILMPTGAEHERLASVGAEFAGGRRVDLSASGGVRGVDVRRVVGASPHRDAVLTEPLADGCVADAEFAGELARRLAIDVSLDHVVEVRNHDWAGHVYDLTTSSTSYWTEDIVVHNCVRAWGARPDVTSVDEAANATGSATPAQNADQTQLAG